MNATAKFLKVNDYVIKFILALYLLNIPQQLGVPVLVSFIVMLWLIILQIYKCYHNYKQQLSNKFDIPFTMIIVAATILFILMELR